MPILPVAPTTATLLTMAHARRRSLAACPATSRPPSTIRSRAELLDEYFASRALGFTGGGLPASRPPDPAAFVPPRGTFLVVFDDDDTAVGCGGVRMLTPGPRRDQAPVARRRRPAAAAGVARCSIELEARAVGLGARIVVLDTNATLEAAQGLYRTSGYDEIEPYNDNPNATHWFEASPGG